MSSQPKKVIVTSVAVTERQMAASPMRTSAAPEQEPDPLRGEVLGDLDVERGHVGGGHGAAPELWGPKLGRKGATVQPFHGLRLDGRPGGPLRSPNRQHAYACRSAAEDLDAARSICGEERAEGGGVDQEVRHTRRGEIGYAAGADEAAGVDGALVDDESGGERETRAGDPTNAGEHKRLAAPSESSAIAPSAAPQPNVLASVG